MTSELRSLAENATQGRWRQQGKWLWRGAGRSSVGERDAAFMAAANPAAILALLDRLESAERTTHATTTATPATAHDERTADE